MNGKLTRTYQTPDGTVRWDVLGEGDPVVLLHGTLVLVARLA